MGIRGLLASVVHIPGLILCVLAATEICAAATAPGPTLIMSDTPQGESAGELVVQAAPQLTSVTRRFYLRNLTANEMSSVQLSAQMELAAVHPTVALPGISVTFASAETANRWLIPAGGAIEVVVTVANLPASGSFSAPIIARLKDSLITLGTLRIDRLLAPSLKVIGAHDQTGIGVAQFSGKFAYLLQISSQNSTPVTDLSLKVFPLTSADAVQTPVIVTHEQKLYDGKKLELPPDGMVQFELSATLQSSGTYISDIQVRYADQSLVVPLTIHRDAAAPTLEIPGGLRAVQLNLGFCGDDVVIPLQLHETAGREVTVNVVRDVGMTRKASATVRFMAPVEGVELLDCNGKPATQPVTVNPNGTVALRLKIKSISDPGEYSGNLTLTHADGSGTGPALLLPLSIVARQNWWIAASFIAGAVLVSMVIRYLMQAVRPRLATLARLASVLEKLQRLAESDDPLTNDEKQVQRALVRRVTVQFEDVANDGVIIEAKTIDALVLEMSQKAGLFPAWVAAWRAVRAVKPPDLGHDARTDLESTRTYLLKPNTTTDEFIDQQNRLSKIEPTLKTAMTASLRDAIRVLRASVDQLLIQDRLAASLRKALEDVWQGPLRLAAEYTASEALPDANQFLEAARRQYVRALIEDLKAGLPATPPPGFDAPDWAATRAGVLEGLSEAQNRSDVDSLESMNAFNAVSVRYTRTLATKLLEHVGADARPEADTLKVELKQLIALAQKPENAAEASASYVSVQDKYNQLTRTAGGAGVAMGEDAALHGPDAAPGPGAAGAQPLTAASYSMPGNIVAKKLLDIQSSVDLTAQTRCIDILLNVVVALVSVALGLYVLWWPNDTWGSVGDCLIALLWGLGVQQAGGVLLDQTDLARRLSGLKASSAAAS